MPGPAATAKNTQPRRYRFADLELDPGQRRVFRDGKAIKLSQLSYEFLRVLVEAAPNLVTHSDLALKVWGPRRIVTPENLTQRLLMLRHSLGDDAVNPRYIETARSQGIRLIPTVEVVSDLSPQTHAGAAGTSVTVTATARTEARARPTARGWHSGIFVAAVAALLVVTVLGWIRESSDTATATPVAEAEAPLSILPEPLPNAIAVLPFEKLNTEPEAAYFFAEGLHAELINELARSVDLSVIARASVLHYSERGAPLDEIADELRVSLIVAGSVRYLQDRVHVIAELLEADTGVQLWSDDFDAAAGEMYAIEHDLAIGIARTLSASLPSTRPADGSDISTSLEAFSFYTRAMDVFNDDMLGAQTTARTFLDEAILLDASFAHAYAGKALVAAYTIINSGDGFDRSTASIEAREQVVRDLAATALSLNPQTDLAYYALGILDLFSWRWQEAHANFERALAISPQHAVFLAQMGWLEVCGMSISEGRRFSQRSVALDPQNPFVHQLFGDVMECSGDPAAALAASERALEADPTSFINRMYRAFRTARVLGPEAGIAELEKLEPLLTRQRLLSLPAVALAYRELGRDADARRLFDRFVDFADGRRTGPANWYLAYLAVDDYDRAYAMLEQAIEQPGPGPGFYTLAAFMRNSGEIAPFNEPRFRELRDRLIAGLESGPIDADSSLPAAPDG